MKDLKLSLVLFAAVFALVAVFRQNAFVLDWDRLAYVFAMNLSYSRAWLLIWETVSLFGRGEFVYVLTGLAALRFLWRRYGRAAGAYVLGMSVLFFINPIFKLLWRLERPVSLSPFSDLSTYTFPSGHAFNSVILCYFLPRFLDHMLGREFSRVYLSRPFLYGGVLAIGMSRVFLGVHWFSDVIGGWALGCVVATFLLLWLARFERAKS